MGRCRVVAVSMFWNHNDCNIFPDRLISRNLPLGSMHGGMELLYRSTLRRSCLSPEDPGVRLRDIATVLGVTERRAFDIVNDLIEAGYVEKEKDGRRNLYRIQTHLPLRETMSKEPTIGEGAGNARRY